MLTDIESFFSSAVNLSLALNAGFANTRAPEFGLQIFITLLTAFPTQTGYAHFFVSLK